MYKKAFHPNAYLRSIRNIKRGVQTRTRILNILDSISADAKTIARETGVRYEVIMHHLRLLEFEGIVERGKGKGKPCIWRSTGAGQKRLSL